MTLVPQNTTVGFVGLGKMGTPMASRLAQAGFRLLVHDANSAALSRFCASEPAARALGPAALAAEADILITILPTGTIVRSFLFGDTAGGAAPADTLRPGSVVVDMSSSEPMGTRELGTMLADRGIDMIDAPVSGGVVRATAGTLAVMMGGQAAVIDRLKPLFAAMCGPQIHVGALGAGHAMKALNNYVSAAGLTAACEALRAAQHFGIDGQRAIDALNASSGRNNSTETKLAQFVLSESYGSGFTTGLMHKDIQIALGLFDELQLEAPLAQAFVPIWGEMTAELGGAADHTEIARLAGRASGTAKP